MNDSPFTSEDQFLSAISASFPNVHPHMLLGRGDDCAVLKCPEAMALTTDLFVEDVHFRRSYFSPADAGYKALAVNLSDLAAMGATPLGFSLGLAGPPETPASYWEEVLDGMAQLAGSLDLPLVGGDLNACEKLVLAVTLWGAPGPSGRLLQRGGCQPSDVLFVVGDLGLAAVGLEVLEELGRSALGEWPEATAAHLRPGIKVAEGLTLARRPGMRGLMDVSDGLLRDLPRFLGSGLGADLAFAPDTLHPEVLRRAWETGRDPALLAVTGGEDYALLGACPRPFFLDVYTHVAGVWAIGEVAGDPGLRLDGRQLRPGGFDHFRMPD
jgi:thiamine-monophosphate kinase